MQSNSVRTATVYMVSYGHMQCGHCGDRAECIIALRGASINLAETSFAGRRH